MTSIELPSDVSALKDMVIREYQRAEQEKQRAELFKFRLEKLTRRYFGPSSEKSQEPSGQQLLFELPQPQATPVVVAAPAQTDAPKRHGGGRKKLPPELIRHRIEYTVNEEERRCPCCQEAMQPFGEEISEQLEYYPASLFVIEHVKIKYTCAKKCEEKPVTAPGPEKVVDKGLAGPGLLAWNVISKFGDHQPNYRQEDIFARHGLEIPRSTQCGWQATVAQLLEPLYKRMVALTLLSGKVHTDDTPIRVLDPGRGKTREARFWVYCGDDGHPFVVFDYTPNRSRDGPEKFLKHFRGYLQADAYVGYNRIFAGKQVIEVACMAHARRYFFDAQDTDARAMQMLTLMRELYGVEELARPLIASARQQPLEKRAAALAQAFALRHQLRQAQSLPITTKMKAWLDARVLDVLPKSPLGEAVTYALNQWTALLRFLENGELEIDNNTAENALRPIALGRKNFLFVGNDNGGRRAAVLYSLIRTCERHGVNPWEYLRDVLVRVATH
ncbi:MAG TPA: IS66 family transposase, partial [Planctomycetota bacterium]